MRFSIFEVVLPLATVFAMSVSGLSKGQDLGSNFEKQLILVESDLEPIGKLATQNVLPVKLVYFQVIISYKMKVFAQEL